MKPKSIYLALCVPGTLLPCSQFVPFLVEHGLDVTRFIDEMFANRIAGAFALDALVSSIVFWVFVFVEGRRGGVRHLWAPITANLAIGLSLGLPLFLYMRERLEHSSPG